MTLPLSSAFTFVLLLLRVSGLLFVAPFFGETQITPRVRLGLSVAVAAAFSLGIHPAVPDLAIGSLAGSALRETFIGVCGGLGARLVFEAAAGAGFLAGASMGLGFGAQASGGSDSPVVSQFIRLLALAAIVEAGVPRELLAGLYNSLRAFPLAAPFAAVPLLQSCVGFGLLSIALAVRVAFPIVAASLLGHIVMGIAGRSAPQVNLQSIGFTSSILAGGSALYLTAPVLARTIAQSTLAALP